MNNNQIKLLIADDQTLMRQGLKELLSPFDDLQVVALAEDGEEAIEKLKELQVDVALVDIRMPKMSGIDVLRKTSEFEISTAIILLTTFNDQEPMIEGLCLGAKGYLLKDVSADRLHKAIIDVAAGKTYYSPAITERIAVGVSNVRDKANESALIESLTAREVEILRLVGSGLSNKDISEALVCSDGTIRNHMSSILGKLDVKDRTQAVLKALDLDLI